LLFSIAYGILVFMPNLSTNKVFKARNAAKQSAKLKLMAMLAQPLRITVDPEQSTSETPWLQAKRGAFIVAEEQSVKDFKATEFSRNETIALVLLDELHGPMTSTMLFKRAMAKLPFLESHGDLWRTYHALKTANLIKFTATKGNGLGGRVELV